MGQNAEVRVTLDDIRWAAEIFGQHDKNLVYLEKELDVKLVARGDKLILIGSKALVEEAVMVINQLQDFARVGNYITLHEINYALKVVRSGSGDSLVKLSEEIVAVTFRGKQVKPKSTGQKSYVDQMKKHDIVFGIGPAGTGKTYLAVAVAVMALRNKEVSRLVLTRPAVEAGEKLGFLPGDLQEKVDPYVRPLYDALNDVLGVETTQKYLERNVIEVAPLAYMRGRTLEDSYIILDEAQNTTPEQMKMFLTRIGYGSKAIITGDITQVDLPRGQTSGLIDAMNKLGKIEGLAFHYMSGNDIVRHPLVQKIVEAYETAERLKADRK